MDGTESAAEGCTEANKSTRNQISLNKLPQAFEKRQTFTIHYKSLFFQILPIVLLENYRPGRLLYSSNEQATRIRTVGHVQLPQYLLMNPYYGIA